MAGEMIKLCVNPYYISGLACLAQSFACSDSWKIYQGIAWLSSDKSGFIIRKKAHLKDDPPPQGSYGIYDKCCTWSPDQDPRLELGNGAVRSQSLGPAMQGG
jgi:hypothetical protein